MMFYKSKRTQPEHTGTPAAVPTMKPQTLFMDCGNQEPGGTSYPAHGQVFLSC